MSKTQALCESLIRQPSITPDDAGCQDLIAAHLKNFDIKLYPFEDVKNFYAEHGQKDGPKLLLLGHTDIVPPGDRAKWQSDPFTPIIKKGYLYGRGAADMKSGLSALVIAAERFVQACPDHPGKLALLITSNEEGNPTHGVQRVVEAFESENIDIDYCLVGEASSREQLGDSIKNGRRGSLNGTLNIQGIQGHIAYPELAENPIHRALAALQCLVETQWDHGKLDFPPTSFQMSDIHAGTGANNVIPERLTVLFNFRYSPASTDANLRQRFEALLKAFNLNYTLDWQHSASPFYTPNGRLLDVTRKSIQKVLGFLPETSTNGGTSDGRFIAPLGAEVVEFGPIYKTIHKANECVRISDLEPLTDIYFEVIRSLLNEKTKQ